MKELVLASGRVLTPQELDLTGEAVELQSQGASAFPSRPGKKVKLTQLGHERKLLQLTKKTQIHVSKLIRRGE